MKDYTIFYKNEIEEKALAEFNFDLFISAYDNTDRVARVYKSVSATEKHWLIFPQYKIKQSDYPQGKYFDYALANEDDYIIRYLEEINIQPKNLNIGIDITGFIRPHLIFMLRILSNMGVKKMHAFYTEPIRYKKSEETLFSGFVDEVKLIPGCGSTEFNSDTQNDLLILAVGYDDKLIVKVAQDKRHCKRKYQIFGFPSLQPDMYQESRLKANNAAESLGKDVVTKFAPAVDPFVTAQLLKEIIDSNTHSKNIYLSPLSTKPQVLGFIIYYLWEGTNKRVNLLYPYSGNYATKTASGIKNTWHYVVELP